jgi:thiamine transport system permease protein
VAFFLLLFVWPMAAIVIRSLAPGAWESLISERLGDVVLFSLVQAALSTVVTLLTGLPGAWAFSRPFRGATALRAMLTVAFVLPSVVVATSFRSLSAAGFGPRGVAAIVAAHAFFNYAVVVRLVGAAWARLPASVEEEARVLGAGRWEVMRRVDWPMLRPAISTAVGLVFLFCFTAFGTVLVLGDLGASTVEVEIWRRAVQFFDLPGATALALAQVAVVAAALFAWARLRPAPAAGWAPTVPRSPISARGRAAALAPGLLLLIAPVGALVTRSFDVGGRPGLRWYRPVTSTDSTSFVEIPSAISNSLSFAAAATAIAVGVGLVAAVVVARRATLATSWLEVITVVPLGASSVTLGLGFLVGFSRSPFDLRDQALLIPLAHALIGIPFVVRALLPAIRAIPASLPEAARTLGRPARSVLRRVELPLVAPALAAAGGFAAAVSLGEFGATMVLSRTGSETIPLAIFRLLGRVGEANQGRAMALAVVLMAVVGAVIALADAILVWHERRIGAAPPVRRRAWRPARG